MKEAKELEEEGANSWEEGLRKRREELWKELDNLTEKRGGEKEWDNLMGGREWKEEKKES